MAKRCWAAPCSWPIWSSPLKCGQHLGLDPHQQNTAKEVRDHITLNKTPMWVDWRETLRAGFGRNTTFCHIQCALFCQNFWGKNKDAHYTWVVLIPYLFKCFNSYLCLCIKSITLESNNDICMQNNTLDTVISFIYK